MTTRRQFIGHCSTLLASAAVLGAARTASSATSPVLQRPIPSTGELLPCIGMGTSGSFEITPGGPAYDALKDVLKRFFDGGSTLIDTAPTYSNAEEVLGMLLAEAKLRPRVFLATKLSGVTGRDQGMRQFQGTLQTLKTDRVELLQVHNLRDWRTQLAVARALKEEGKVKYVGVTHYLDSAHDELAEVVAASTPDFLQINISVTNRNASRRLLPLAQDLGVAVLANRNFNDGALFRKTANKALPAWAAEAGITSWAQMFLKFVLSYEAVTAVIPATGKPDRQSDNLKAGLGSLLTPKQQEEVVALVG